MYALVVDNNEVRKDLVLHGLDVDGIDLEFNYHKRDLLKVYLSNIPCGVPTRDILNAFDCYGIIKHVEKLRNTFHGVRLDSDDRLIIFEKMTKPIPSYIRVRGWLGYVKYKGQVPTCRHCEKSGHVFANCPSKNGKGTMPEEKPRREEPENMDVHEPLPPNEPHVSQEEIQSTPSIQEEEPNVYQKKY